MLLIIISFFSGILSVLAPCVLPVIPVIFGSNLDNTNKYKPLRIIGSLMVCIFVFTFVLKVSTALIGIPSSVWTWISGVIIGLYGITLAMPQWWELIQSKLPQVSIGQSSSKRGDYIIGASLGPIFATCSPTYALLLSTVLPASNIMGVVGLIAYLIGFGGFLYALVIGGRGLIRKFYKLADSSGVFKRVLGVVLIITAVLIASGYMKKIESNLINIVPDVGKIESKLIDSIDVSSYQQASVDTESIEENPQDGEITTTEEIAEGKITQPIVPSQTSNSSEGGEELTNLEELDNPEGLDSVDEEVAVSDKTTENTINSLLLSTPYPAPQLAGLTNWINSQGYTSMKELKGRVVLVDFWTYSCINCINTLPHIQQLHETYADQGLTVLGLHAPEFQYERVLSNLQAAVKQYGLSYPIAQDNDFTTWKSYNNKYRPAQYLIDKQGNVVYTHFGEGSYEQTDQVIQYLLKQ